MSKEAAKTEEVPDRYLAGYDELDDAWISTSALSTLMMCGLRFYYRYVMRLPEPTSIRKSIGISAHRGRETNLSQKVLSKTDLDLDQVTDAARDAVRKEFANNEVQIEKEFSGKDLERARDLAIDYTTEITTKDFAEFQVKIQPTGVEEAYAVRYPGLERTIVGRVDTNIDADGKSIILDYKTGKRAYGQDKIDASMQISTYGLLKYATTGQLPDEYIIHNVTKASKEATCKIFTTHRTVEQLQQQLDRYAAWAKIIEAGNFAPCDPNSWCCSSDWCGFWSQCRFGGGK